MGTEQNNEPKAGEDEATNAGATRREAIKKAAGAAAVAGTVWAAPRVEGLSLVPSYAAAATSLYLVDNSTDGTLSGPVQIAPGVWYKFRTFTSSGTFNVQSVGSSLAGGDFIEALIIGGGGGGSLGGGGGGEFRQLTGVNKITLLPTATGAYNVTVGAGGTGVLSAPFWLGGTSYAADPAASVGGDGGASSLVRTGVGAFSYSAAGGGGGGSLPRVLAGATDTTYARGRNGASGGGAGYNNIEPTRSLAPAGNIPGGTASSGNVGGQTRRDQLQFFTVVITRAGGGGGAGGAGIQGFDRQATANGSDGGAGVSTSFTGTPVWYGGGGGGSNLKLTATNYTQPLGGQGGGGKGTYGTSTPTLGTPGQANTGGGGGGGRTTGGTTSMSILNGQDGGSGIVIVRYRCAQP